MLMTMAAMVAIVMSVHYTQLSSAMAMPISSAAQELSVNALRPVVVAFRCFFAREPASPGHQPEVH